MKEVIISFDGEGGFEIEVKGVKGRDCRKVTEDLEKALGAVTGDRLTPEFHQHEEVRHARQ